MVLTLLASRYTIDKNRSNTCISILDRNARVYNCSMQISYKQISDTVIPNAYAIIRQYNIPVDMTLLEVSISGDGEPRDSLSCTMPLYREIEIKSPVYSALILSAA